MISFDSNQYQSDGERSLEPSVSTAVTRQEEGNTDDIERDQHVEDEALQADYVSEPDMANNAKISADDTTHESDDTNLENASFGPRIRRALHFFSHPSLLDISPNEKESYLESKGYSKDEIALINHYAEKMVDKNQRSSRILVNLDRVWDQSTPSDSSNLMDRIDNPNQQPHSSQYPFTNLVSQPLVDQSHLPDIPNPIVPMTVGGAIVVFGMAAFRWLNGGDFVLFPSSSSRDDSTSEPQDGHVQTSHNDDGKGSDINHDEIECLTDKDLPSICTHDHSVVLHNHLKQQQQPEQVDRICKDLQSLTAAIESYTSMQVEKIKTKANEKAKDKTDNAMVLLKQQSSRTGYAERSNQDSDQEFPYHVQTPLEVNILVKIIETKYTLETLLDKVNSIPSMQNNEQSFAMNEISETLNEIHKNIGSIKSHLLNKEEGEDGVNISKHLKETGTKSQTFSFEGASAKQMETSHTCLDRGNRVDGSSTKKQTKECVDKSGENVLFCGHQVGNKALEDAIKNFKENNPPVAAMATCQMLLLYVTNLEENPTSERYQKIYTGSNKFKTLIANVPYAKEILYTIGFVDDGSFLKWKHVEKDESGTSNMIQLLQKAKLSIEGLCEDIQL